MGGRPVSKMHHNYNPDFDKLLRDADHNRIFAKLPYSALFPPYYGTRLYEEMKDAKSRSRGYREGDD